MRLNFTPRLSRKTFEDYLLPALVLVAVLGAWEFYVRWANVPQYLLPAPSQVARTLVVDWPSLGQSLMVTLSITCEGLVAAVVGGVALALLFHAWRPLERAFFPFAVVMQVTPIIAIAPLLLVWLSAGQTVLLTAFLVTFFPILANTALGLAAAEHNLVELFELYGASRWRQLTLLRLPSALPYFLGGLRIGGGLSLIGAIVAELAAGSTGRHSGLESRIVEASFRGEIARMFAALFLIQISGIVIFVFFNGLSWLLLHRWHDSARARER